MWKRAWTDTLPSLGLHNWRNLIRSIVLVLIALLIVRLVGGQAQMGEEFVWIISTLAAIAVVFLITFIFHLIRAPIYIKWEKEKEKRLKVSLPEPRYDYLEDQWIRLQVENPTTLPIPNCYGKLLSYRLVSFESRKDGILLEEVQVSPEAGSHTTRQSGELPPQRHMFPWSPISLPEIIITIPGHNSSEFLYIAMKRRSEGCFYTPTDMGLMYPNYGLGNFELELEIGSNSEPFKPARVRLVFYAFDLEAKNFELLD